MRALLDLLTEAWHAIRGSPGLSVLAFLILCVGWVSSITGIGMAYVFSTSEQRALPAHFKIIGETEGAASGFIWGADAIALRQQLPEPLLSRSIMVRSRWLNVSDGFRPSQVEGTWIDGPLFEELGWTMALGRGFNDAERTGKRPVMIISHRFWKSQFAGAADVIGKLLKIDGLSREVVGVLPPFRAFPFHQQIYLPTQMDAESPLTKRYVMLLLNAAPEQLLALDSSIQAFNQAALKKLGAGKGQARQVSARNLLETGFNRESKLVIGLMMFLSQLLMFVAACNAGGLLLIRWVLRSAELATRASLGATVKRLAAAALAQALLIAAVALAVALVISRFVAGYLQSFFHTNQNGVPEYIQFDLGLRGIVPLLCALLLTVTVVAAPVVWRLSKSNLNSELKKRERGMSADYRLGKFLLCVQCIFAVASVAVAITASLGAWQAKRFDYGVTGEGVLMTTVRSTQLTAQKDFAEQLAQQLRLEQSVSAVSVGVAVPQAAISMRDLLDPDKDAPMPRKTVVFAEVDGYFADVYGISLSAGRWLTVDSGVKTSAEVVINESLAVERFGTASAAIGQSLTYLEVDGETRTSVLIVGVSGAARMDVDLAAKEFLVFAPVSKNAVAATSISIKTKYARPQSLIPRLEQLALELNDTLALTPPRVYRQWRDESTTGFDVVANMFLPVGLVAMLMTASGLGALLSTMVAQRMRDCSLRRALGAPGVQLVRPLLQSLWITCGVGVALGLAIAVPLTQKLNQVLYSDSLSIVLILSLTLLIVFLTLSLACVRPLWRALHADPMEILRQI